MHNQPILFTVKIIVTTVIATALLFNSCKKDDPEKDKRKRQEREEERKTKEAIANMYPYKDAKEDGWVPKRIDGAIRTHEWQAESIAKTDEINKKLTGYTYQLVSIEKQRSKEDASRSFGYGPTWDVSFLLEECKRDDVYQLLNLHHGSEGLSMKPTWKRLNGENKCGQHVPKERSVHGRNLHDKNMPDEESAYGNLIAHFSGDEGVFIWLPDFLKDGLKAKVYYVDKFNEQELIVSDLAEPSDPRSDMLIFTLKRIN